MTNSLAHLRRRAELGEQGDTLIELLIAIVIIALTVTALLGALVTAITSSTTEQGISTVDTVLNNFAQSAQYEAQQSYATCTSSPYRLISAPMPASGPVGATVTVFVTGFTANHRLTMTLTSGATTTPVNIVSGVTTNSSGDATVSFAVPNVSGSQTVSVSDGTSVSSPTPFVVGGTADGQAPTGYQISVDPVEQWSASGWMTPGSGPCTNSGAQQIIAFAQGPGGTSGTLGFVVLHSATTTVLVSATFQNPPGVTSTQAILGATLTFTATVVPPNSTTPNPTGSVQWAFSQSPGNPTCPNSTLSNIAGINESDATCTVTNAEVGQYNVTANYNQPGAGCTNCNYGPGSGSGTITPGEANSSTVLSTSSSPSPALPGSTLSFKATIGASPADANDPQPGGVVIWTITPPAGATTPKCNGLNGGQPTDTQQMTSSTNGTNSTTCSFTATTTGTYSASAVYQGDGNYNPSQSSSAATISVSKALPTLSLSTSPQKPQVGSSFTVTVTVNGTGGISTQGGSLSWTITPPSGTAPTCTTVTLPASEQATCSVSNAVVGTYTVAASYGGNADYTAASGSTQVGVTLAPAGFDIQTLGNPADNKPDTGDQIVYTFNQAMSLNSIYPVRAGWNGSSVNVTAAFTRSNGATSLAIVCSGFGCTSPNLGTVSLGDTGASHYISGGGSGGNTVNLNATMTASTNASGQTVITITLTSSSGQFSAVTGNTTLMWTPSNAATNTAIPAVACATTAAAESGSPKANF